MHFLGIEIGHGSVCAGALDLEAARVVSRSAVPLDWLEGLPEGYAEQDPARWIASVDHVVRSVLDGLGADRESVAAVAVTAPAGGLVVLDAVDRIIRPAKRGCDRSAVAEVEEIGRVFGGGPGLIEMTGNALDAGSMAAQLRWLRLHEPKGFKRSARVFAAADFIGYWLTGESGTSASVAAAGGLLDVGAGDWCAALVDFIDPSLAGKLPEILPSRRARGVLRPSLAQAWGLPEGVLVATGCDTGAAELFASGAAVAGNQLADVSPGGALVGLSTEVRVDFRGEGRVGRTVAGEGYTRMAMRNVTAAAELVRRHHGWSLPEFDRWMAEAPVGAAGLLFLPYLRGESVPRLPEGCGVLHGITLDNYTPANLVRAAAEGVALGFGYAMSRMRDIGFEPGEVRLTHDIGPTSTQMLADVFGLPVVSVSGGGGTLLGAAMQAAVAYFDDRGQNLGFDEIAGYVVTLEEATRCTPDPERCRFYEEILARQQYLAEILHESGFL